MNQRRNQNLWCETKKKLRGNLIDINAYIRKKKRVPIFLISISRIQKKEDQMKFKASNRNEITKKKKSV